MLISDIYHIVIEKLFQNISNKLSDVCSIKYMCLFVFGNWNKKP